MLLLFYIVHLLHVEVNSEKHGNLTTLTLNCNNRSLEDFPSENPKTKFLSIQYNKITQISRHSLQYYDNLKELDASFNRIIWIENGAFEGQRNLVKLYLQGNMLSSLEDGVFRGAPNLTDLNIGGNMLFAIEGGTFKGLSKLKKLHLDKNKLIFLADGVFLHLPMLTNLNLRSNKLHDRSLPKGLLKTLTSLEVLHMSSNRLTTLPSDFFQGLNRLKKVSLNNNLLTAVNMQQWPNVEYQLVDLKDNPLIRITNVPERVVELKASLDLNCTCENERALVLILGPLNQTIASICANLSCISQTVTTLTVLEETRQLGMPPPSSAPSHSYWSYTWLYLSVILTCTLL